MNMDRHSISRTDLKKNFLKEIIMRLDFQGVLQAEMEGILLLAKPYLKEKSFNRYEEKLDHIINNDGNTTDIKSQLTYSFVAESLGYTLELSNTSIILTVRSQNYSPFNNYATIFCHIAGIYKTKIDFFTAKRFGLRKINFCFIKNRKDINKYFIADYYYCEAPIDAYSSVSTERKERLSDGISNINLTHAIEEGQVGSETYYRVTLDSDIYVTNQHEIEKVVFQEEVLNQINDKLFAIYVKGITNEFLVQLMSDDEFDTEAILGVEING